MNILDNRSANRQIKYAYGINPNKQNMAVASSYILYRKMCKDLDNVMQHNKIILNLSEVTLERKVNKAKELLDRMNKSKLITYSELSYKDKFKKVFK